MVNKVEYLSIFCRAVVGLVFAASVMGKVTGRERFKAFVTWVAEMPLPLTNRPQTIAVLVVMTEAAIVVTVTISATAQLGLILAALILGLFATSTFVLVRRGIRTPCLCFGRSTSPMSMEHVYRDLLVLAIAIAGLFGAGSGQPLIGGVALSASGAAVAALLIVSWEDLAFLVRDANG